ncbi:nitrate- and nitrite sensing domain-containing protein [Nonomuraea sp. NPDC049714]|uniref:sensor histidine kinase n=1 Tax=Nonomuraea sp. NPDC049714 TaxID=3364357 RepID=UPI0037AAFCEC
MSTELGQRPPEEGNWRLRNWRVRARLVALILVPTAAAVLLGGFQVFASTGAAADFARTNQLAQLSAQIGELTHVVSGERARTSWFIARNRPASALPPVREQMEQVDDVIGEVRTSADALLLTVTGRTADQIQNMLNRLDDLTGLREQALEADLLPAASVELYTTVINDLLSVHNELIKGSQDDELFRQSRMLDALARAKESVSHQQALLTTVLTEGAFSQDQLKRFLGELSREENERRTFADEATAEERRIFDENVNGRSADNMLFLRELVLIRATAGQTVRGLDQGNRDDAGQWFEASNVVVDSMRLVEQRQAAGIVTRSEALSADERQRAYVIAGAVIALLVAVLLITTGVARSLVRPLRRLRAEALDIAGKRLPDFVQHLRESRDGVVDAEVPPINVFSRDEVGEVARAFDEVHREAVRLAGDEARLRANVNSMFVNLSRRSQTLVERQLSLIERLERGERDDDRLGDLFKLDHLATRMRRNSENLLVLAGQEAARKWSQPVELMDVVRAALGEVESYDRVSIQVQSETAIAGQGVNDVVHLLAELIENAVSFSARDTKVIISSSRIDGGGLMVSVTDNGISMNAEELTEANWRLANPPVVDVSVSRRMGLFVVGRLALRHNIRVQLRRQDVGGLTAMVLLPETLLTAMPGSAPDASVLRTAVSAPEMMPYAQVPMQSMPSMPSMPPMMPTPSMPGPGHPSLDMTPAPEPSSWFSSQYTNSVELPSEPFPSQEPAQGDFLPIFASVESSWFTKPSFTPDRREPDPDPAWSSSGAPSWPSQEETSWPSQGEVTPAPLPTRAARAPQDDAGPMTPPRAPVEWSSPADSGWQAAGAVREPALGGTTSSGLPKRTPKANLVPGSAAPASAPMPAPPVSPDRLRSRLSSYQQGVRKGRAELEED